MSSPDPQVRAARNQSTTSPAVRGPVVAITGAASGVGALLTERLAASEAIKQVIANLKSKNFNCLEITRVAAKRSLGLPHVSVSAQSRHIQEAPALSGE